MAALRRKAAATRKDVNLEEMVASGAEGSYEALQLYRSRTNRFKTKNDIKGAITTAANGAKCFLEHNYETAGGELATLFLELLTEQNMEITDSLRNLAIGIDEKFPPKSQVRVEFLKGCVKWTISSGKFELGDAMLQTRFGECLWDRDDKTAASHFAAGDAPEAYNTKIFEKYGENAEQQEKRDQSLTLGITNFLALENLRDANELMRCFKKECKAKGFTTDSELMKFNEFLLQVSRRDAAPLFKKLVNAYADKLDFDETVPELLLGPIAVRLFGIMPKVNPMMSMLQSMLT